MLQIISLLPPIPRIKITDVGAMNVGHDPYSQLVATAPCDILGFEPNAAECGKLTKENKPGRKYLPYFIGDGSRQTFYECNYPMTSSLFEPNTALLEKFQNLEELTRVVKIHPVETRRLDDIPEAQGTAFLKIDTQGAEVLVLKGAARTLDSVLVVHTEACFVPLYKNQALFADIDIMLRTHGFVLSQMMPAGRIFKPLVWKNDISARMNQLLWADVVYVRDFLTFDRLAPEQLLALAVILHQNYAACDLAQLALAAYDRQKGTQFQTQYNERLVKLNIGFSISAESG